MCFDPLTTGFFFILPQGAASGKRLVVQRTAKWLRPLGSKRISGNTPNMAEDRCSILETFENPHPGRDYAIEIVAPEFTSVCPRTGQPDFGELTITYTPAAKCVELKSLKFYLQSYRNDGIFYEDVTNRILDDLVSVLAPRAMKIVGRYAPRGGITTTVTAVHEANR